MVTEAQRQKAREITSRFKVMSVDGSLESAIATALASVEVEGEAERSKLQNNLNAWLKEAIRVKTASEDFKWPEQASFSDAVLQAVVAAEARGIERAVELCRETARDYATRAARLNQDDSEAAQSFAHDYLTKAEVLRTMAESTSEAQINELPIERLSDQQLAALVQHHKNEAHRFSCEEAKAWRVRLRMGHGTDEDKALAALIGVFPESPAVAQPSTCTKCGSQTELQMVCEKCGDSLKDLG